jgi:hypothetical protein
MVFLRMTELDAIHCIYSVNMAGIKRKIRRIRGCGQDSREGFETQITKVEMSLRMAENFTGRYF